MYGNCSLVLYIYRCTLCQGQGNCVGFILSFQGSISEAICETGQIKLVLRDVVFVTEPGLQVPPAPKYSFIQIWSMNLTCVKKGKKAHPRFTHRLPGFPFTHMMLTNHPKPLLYKRHFSQLNRSQFDQLLTFSTNTEPVFRLVPPCATPHISGVSGRN